MGFPWTARIRSLIVLGRAGDVERVREGGLDPVGGQDQNVARTDVESRGSHTWQLVPEDAAPKREIALRPQCGRVSAQHEPLHVSHAEPRQVRVR